MLAVLLLQINAGMQACGVLLWWYDETKCINAFSSCLFSWPPQPIPTWLVWRALASQFVPAVLRLPHVCAQIERLLRVHRCRTTQQLLQQAEEADEALAQYEEQASHVVGCNYCLLVIGLRQHSR